MTIEQYIDNINKRFKLGNATEHTFRGDLQQLLESSMPTIRATNEPKRQSCGAPDYILTKNDIPVGFIEAKDLGDGDLAGAKKTGNKEQFDRYKAALPNIIFTDYIDFHFYRNGEFTTKVSIGELTGKGVVPLPGNFHQFEALLKDFSFYEGQTIKSPKTLAMMMADKARLLADIIEKALTSDEENQENSSLQDQMNAFKSILIHDITPKGFADVYAQTIAYGMFAARLYDTSLDTFSRQEAATLIPKSNPFLRKLFQYIAGYDLDERINWIVDSLADMFRSADIATILKNFGKSTKQHDPIIHFYETFLGEYDPKLRRSRGVWYTPEPVVDFIVRAVDDILKDEFDLPMGLADTSKTKIQVDAQGKKKIDQEVHRVQILDPATGTGTFLAAVIKQIHKSFEGQGGLWNNYVEEHLIPRLNGFEILMASYSMAHLKLDMLLSETGFKSSKDQRFRVFLTNSLEEHHPNTGELWATVLANEANAANYIKRDTPVMCVIGNPPYSGISSNNGPWISRLIDDYKYVDGVHFNERKHWLNDDYVKFLRYGQHFIEKKRSGVLAFINPHGFLDNPTFRGMRWNLLKTYDKIYTIDLHGNTKKNETAPDGSADVNVFDIQQGVSVNIFIKTGKKKQNQLAKVFHFDLFGKREAKYDFLYSNSIKSTKFKELNPQKPNLFFVPKNDTGDTNYYNGINVYQIFKMNSTGIQTSRDSLVIDFDKKALLKRINLFCDTSKSDDEIRNMFFQNKKTDKYKKGDTRGWKIESVRKKLISEDLESQIVKLSYRPFDKRYLFYSDSMVDWTRRNVMQHIESRDNVCLLIPRQLAEDSFHHILVENTISEMCVISNKTKEQNVVFPLYRYPETNGQHTNELTIERTPNLNTEIVKQIAEKLGLTFINEKDDTDGTFAPIDILDYIYGVLHSPSYREKYKEFLKIDFPRVPYPKDADQFWKFVQLGGELRQIHLLESPIVEKRITTYPNSGTNEVEKPVYEDGNVWINKEQYFDGVPEVAWSFYIGGYQPAQKWLKDRKGRVLNFEDILHYQKIIVALSETDRLMKEIDKIESG
ncbi:type ISP restriction/modification enzyme [Geofilum rhodophaeum]|uniref:type ISP restriction/modification enzyme n=1 Tax=Geofilum rhodophaeum TaxID=1965019 RepID=UPI000B529096|nr:type ISP restriction/modification enzyme [Geofilum rhodophaeum]